MQNLKHLLRCEDGSDEAGCLWPPTENCFEVATGLNLLPIWSEEADISRSGSGSSVAAAQRCRWSSRSPPPSLPINRLTHYLCQADSRQLKFKVCLKMCSDQVGYSLNAMNNPTAMTRTRSDAIWSTHLRTFFSTGLLQSSQASLRWFIDSSSRLFLFSVDFPAW